MPIVYRSYNVLILAMIKLQVFYESYNVLTRNIQGILQSYEVFYRVSSASLWPIRLQYLLQLGENMSNLIPPLQLLHENMSIL